MKTYRAYNAAALFLVCAWSPLPVLAEARAAQAAVGCTPPPALMDNWKQRVIAEMGKSQGVVSEDEIKSYLAKAREDVVQHRNTVFERIAAMTPSERAADNEVVLWESRSIMVLVDKFVNLPKVLVVPKATGIWLLSDADADLLGELTRIVRTAADAVVAAMADACDPGLVQARIGSPKEVHVRQLHVHIEPLATSKSLTQQEWSDRIAENLKSRLGPSAQKQTN